MNLKIKKRELFRPLAPVVIEESFSRFFDGMPSRLTSLMLQAVPVTQKYRDQLEEITHIDGTARVQSLHLNDNPLLHNLLMEHGNITGIPILLNTSLNGNGMPITERPEDTYDLFLNTDIDIAVINGTIFEKPNNSVNSDSVKLRHFVL
ncbi:carbamoyltransferase C-terminal domain-containing protein [Ectothiorhodospira sp. BSL-9]|uniref:carbamoyltransferase C-terminal domain-containing protein n=1 Tax=Ectothiorhodospira sp. BSL-9 TaxID=1442136 RepID=UPI0009EE8D3D|nr:carbamoyltransferase C-terminal domain-containing protein [Ectothiorhodospira sp. BSL-9]